MSGDIPVVEIYKGVGIHNCQPRERIERRVKPEIDYVLEISNMHQLADYAGDISKPPEARLLAGAKCEAIFQLAVSERRARPEIDIERLQASYLGAGSQHWRDPWSYCCLIDVRGRAEPEPREVPLPGHYSR